MPGSYRRVMVRAVAALPFGLDRVVAPSLLGFAVLNAGTFSVDLTVLTLLHGGLGWPLAASITVSYVLAFALSYLLNRTLNFDSHGPVGRQLGVYVVVVAVNYLVWILGVGDGLTHLGVDYRVSRLLAAVCEADYMYAAMRWLVFRSPFVHLGAVR